MRGSSYPSILELDNVYSGSDAFVSLMQRCDELRRRSSQGERVLPEFHALWNDAFTDITLNLLSAHEALQVGRRIGILESRMMRNFKQTEHEANHE